MHIVMRYALWSVNAQCINLFAKYAFMNTPHDRLKQARKDAGYRTARDGAERLGVPYGTYAGHENGNRGIKPAEAESYAKAFKVRPEWILYGKVGPEPLTNSENPQPPLKPIVKAIEDSLDGLTEKEQRTIADYVARQRALFRPEESG